MSCFTLQFHDMSRELSIIALSNLISLLVQVCFTEDSAARGSLRPTDTGSSTWLLCGPGTRSYRGQSGGSCMGWMDGWEAICALIFDNNIIFLSGRNSRYGWKYTEIIY